MPGYGAGGYGAGGYGGGTVPAELCPLVYANPAPVVNVAGAVLAFQTGVYKLKRTHAREPLPTGIIPPAIEALYDIGAGIFPASRKESRDAEGNYAQGAIVIYTLVALEVTSDDCAADQVYYKGAWYEISDVEGWSDSGGFYKAIAVLA